MHNWQRTIIGILIACLALASVPAHAESGVRAGAIAQAGADQYTVGDCSRVDKAQVRDEIEAHALAVINASGTPADIDSLVARKWADLDMDAAVDCRRAAGRQQPWRAGSLLGQAALRLVGREGAGICRTRRQ